MYSNFVETVGTISIGTGESTALGTGTNFAGKDRDGAVILICPVDAAPFIAGAVAAVTPRGEYNELELPLVRPWNGAPIVNQPFELIDSVAMAQSATLAAVFARFVQYLGQTFGLTGNLADMPVDTTAEVWARVPNNAIFVDAVTRTLYAWRGGVLEPVNTIGIAFNPRGSYDAGTTYAKNDLVQIGNSVFISNADGNVGNAPTSSPTPDSNTYWTLLPMPRGGDHFVLSFFCQGRPLANELIGRWNLPTTVNFAENFVLSQIAAGVAATATTVYTISRIVAGSPVAFGTLTWAAGQKVPTFATDVGGKVCSAGDIVELRAASTPDATLADISGSFLGVRSGGSDNVHSDQAYTWSMQQTFSMSADGAAPVKIVGTNGSANAGPFVDIFRDSASPAAADAMGVVQFSGRDSAGNATVFGKIAATLLTATDAAEAGEIAIGTIVAGTFGANRFRVGNGVQVGSPTGGYKGDGTLNAAGYYVNGVPMWRQVLKTADETKTTNTTLAADGVLKFTMAASQKYAVRGRIYFTTGATGDFKARHTGPASPTLVMIQRRAVAAGASADSSLAVDAAYSSADITALGGAGSGVIEFDGIIYNGTNAGDFAWQWAQNTSDGTATVVKAGSYLEWRLIE
jgi:hypothetical protein